MTNTDKKDEKLIITLADKSTASLLKKDLLDAGVPSEAVKLKTNKKDNNCDITINNVYDHFNKIIKLFRSDGYDLSFEEIEKLFNINIHF